MPEAELSCLHSINTHEHIYSSFARGLSIKGYNPKGFLDILDGQW